MSKQRATWMVVATAFSILCSTNAFAQTLSELRADRHTDYVDWKVNWIVQNASDISTMISDNGRFWSEQGNAFTSIGQADDFCEDALDDWEYWSDVAQKLEETKLALEALVALEPNQNLTNPQLYQRYRASYLEPALRVCNIAINDVERIQYERIMDLLHQFPGRRP